jgi:hypothetical protein
MPAMSKEELIKYIEDKGCCDLLDGDVHEVMSLHASNINNGGAQEQVDFLLKEGVELSYIQALVEEE